MHSERLEKAKRDSYNLGIGDALKPTKLHPGNAYEYVEALTLLIGVSTTAQGEVRCTRHSSMVYEVLYSNYVLSLLDGECHSRYPIDFEPQP